jgi:hypothetical protein
VKCSAFYEVRTESVNSIQANFDFIGLNRICHVFAFHTQLLSVVNGISECLFSFSITTCKLSVSFPLLRLQCMTHYKLMKTYH